MESGWCNEDDKLLGILSVQFKFDWKKIHAKFLQEGGHKASPTFLKNRYHKIKHVINGEKKPIT